MCVKERKWACCERIFRSLFLLMILDIFHSCFSTIESLFLIIFCRFPFLLLFPFSLSLLLQRLRVWREEDEPLLSRTTLRSPQPIPILLLLQVSRLLLPPRIGVQEAVGREVVTPLRPLPVEGKEHDVLPMRPHHLLRGVRE